MTGVCHPPSVVKGRMVFLNFCTFYDAEVSFRVVTSKFGNFYGITFLDQDSIVRLLQVVQQVPDILTTYLLNPVENSISDLENLFFFFSICKIFFPSSIEHI